MHVARAHSIKSPERLDEIAEILAAGLVRLRARKSSQISAHSGESSLDCAADQSGHPNLLNGRIAG
jgi:hypothetical protein